MWPLSLLSTLVIPLAGATPDRVASEVEDAASTGISHLTVHADTGWALALTPEGLRAVDLETWDVLAVATCTSPAGLALWESSTDGALHVFVGCESGEVERVVLTADREVDTAQGESAAVADGEVLGLAVLSDTLWVVSDGEDGTEVRSLPVDDLSDLDLGPSALSFDPVEDVDTVGSYLLVLHGNDDLSRVDSTTANAALPQENLPGRDFVDMATWGGAGVFLADTQGALVRYVIAGINDFQILLDDEDGLGSVNTVAVAAEGDWIALGDTDLQELLFFTLDGANYAVEDEVLERVDLSAQGELKRLASVGELLLAATADGRLLVLTALPWVDFTESPNGDLAVGDLFNLGFTADTAGDWELRFGSPTGELLGSGSVAAGEAGLISLTVDEGYGEGRNRLYLVLDSTRGEGIYAVDVSVDNPPGEVEVVSVGFSDESILLELQGDGSEDLARFDIYISTVPFTAEEWPEGGPEYAGADDGVSSPTSVELEDPTEVVSVTLDGLTNEVVYYLGVRAVDEADTEGPMTDVFTAIPTPTLGAAALAGDTGGLCGVRPGAATWPLGLLALLALRRRSAPTSGLAVGVGLAAALLAPCPALALEPSQEATKGWNRDDVDLRLVRNTEVRLGPLDLSDPNIATVYGTTGLVQLDLQSGVQLFRLLEVDAGLGLTRRQGTLVSADGDASTEVGKLTLIPLSLSGTLRLDLFDGQPLVPYASAGLDYWLWRERLGTPSLEEMFAMDAVNGGKAGYHLALGANLLLDWADRERADLAYARWGIHDTYIVGEWRKNQLFTSDGLTFDGSVFSIGVKIDH